LRRAINEVYLTMQRLPVKAVFNEVGRICAAEGIKAPSHNTVHARIAIIAPAIRTQCRLGSKAAFRLEPHPHAFPAPQCPLEVVQVDHTKLDIDLVDEATRLPIGRPWITVGIDIPSVCLAFATSAAVSTEGLSVAISAHSISAMLSQGAAAIVAGECRAFLIFGWLQAGP
jgi:putative transposase